MIRANLPSHKTIIQTLSHALYAGAICSIFACKTPQQSTASHKPLLADKCLIHVDTIDAVQLYNQHNNKIDTVSLSQAIQCLGRTSNAFPRCTRLQQWLNERSPSEQQAISRLPTESKEIYLDEAQTIYRKENIFPFPVHIHNTYNRVYNPYGNDDLILKNGSAIGKPYALSQTIAYDTIGNIVARHIALLGDSVTQRTVPHSFYQDMTDAFIHGQSLAIDATQTRQQLYYGVIMHEFYVPPKDTSAQAIYNSLALSHQKTSDYLLMQKQKNLHEIQQYLPEVMYSYQIYHDECPGPLDDRANNGVNSKAIMENAYRNLYNQDPIGLRDPRPQEQTTDCPVLQQQGTSLIINDTDCPGGTYELTILTQSGTIVKEYHNINGNERIRLDEALTSYPNGSYIIICVGNNTTTSTVYIK